MQKLNVLQKSYLTQYISLILIILSCMVGASQTKPRTGGGFNYKEIPTLENPNALKSEVPLDSVFIAGNAEIDSSALEPIKTLLENHKLDVEFVVSANEKISERVFQLSKVLRERGFWKDSFSIRGVLDSKVENPRLVAHFDWVDS